MTKAASKPLFHQDGLRFECQGSGKCCTSRGTYGFVYFDDEDRKRMAKSLGIPTGTFTRQYCKKTQGHWHLKDPKNDCVFLKDKRCSAYEGRPKQCRTWPFWPENLNAKAWNLEIASFCPGVGKGKLYTREEIELISRDGADADNEGRA